MKKFLLLLVSFAWLLSGQAQPLPAAPALPVQVQSPKIVTGYQWTYRRLDMRKKEESERFLQAFQTERDGYWTVQWSILSSSDANRLGTTPERFESATQSFADPKLTGLHQPLNFPLTLGKTWSFKYRYETKPGAHVEVDQTATVKAWEDVSTPAGTFKALRVEHAGWYTASEGGKRWRGRISEIYWYSPDALRVVAKEYRDATPSGATWEHHRDELVALRFW